MEVKKTVDEKKKILFIVEAMGGGVFTYIVDLANQLVNTYDLFIGYSTRTQTPIDYKEYFDKRIHLINIENFTRSINPVQDAKSFFEIKQIAKKIKPDIIHLHSSKAGVLGRWAFNGHSIPIFYTPHGYSFLMTDQVRVKRLFYKLIEYVSAKRYCTTISCSNGEYQESSKFSNRILYVDNGINLHELQKTINSIDVKESQQYTVFTLGRICYQKNPKLFNQIAEKMPEVKFIWIGDGELRNELIAPNIQITGWIDRNEALKYALNSNVFILTSLWEGLPISLLESMYLKKICIVSDVIGNRDVIKNNINGFVCNTLDEFVKSIEFAKTENLKDLIQVAYTAIMEHYNTDNMASEYTRIYEEAMKNEFA